MLVLHEPFGYGQQSGEHCLSFDILYERYFLRIYRYLRAHLSCEEDVADLTQQIFFQAWLQLHSYRPERGSFATWLFSIARHRLIDFYRTARAKSSWESIEQVVLVEIDPQELLISAEALARMQALLDALPQAERELLALRFAARLSIAEIAALLGKSVEATKKQLSRLLQRLRKLYREQECEDRQLSEIALSTCIAAIQMIYAVSPATTCITFLCATSAFTRPKGFV